MICATNTIVDEDEAFIRAFEDATLAPENFRHRDHIRLAWLYLQNYTVPETLTRYSRGIKNFARANGKENLYHETITWAFIFLVEERMESSPDKNMDWGLGNVCRRKFRFVELAGLHLEPILPDGSSIFQPGQTNFHFT